MCDAAETGRGMFPWHIFKMPARVRGRAPSGPSVADCAACFCACRIAVPKTALLREPMRPEHLRHRHDWLCGERVVRTYAFVYQGRPGGPAYFLKCLPVCTARVRPLWPVGCSFCCMCSPAGLLCLSKCCSGAVKPEHLRHQHDWLCDAHLYVGVACISEIPSRMSPGPGERTPGCQTQ